MKALRMIGWFVAMTLMALMFVWLGSYMTSKPTNAQVKKMYKCKDARDYQLELYMDTVWLYDGDRLVGRYTDTAWDSPLDSLIIKDNQ